MPKYRFKEGFTHYHKFPAQLEAGAVVTMSEKRYSSLKDRFELMQEYEEIPLSEPVPVPEVEDEPTTADEDNASEWISELASLGFKQARNTASVIDDLDVLLALLEVETRKTVITAIENRIEELS